MVELANIPNANVDEKTSAPDNTDDIHSVSQEHHQTKTEATTSQPIHNIVNNKVINAWNSPSGLSSNKAIVINTVKKQCNGKPKLEVSRDKQRELPYIWLSLRNIDSETSEVEDKESLYSVVRKSKKVPLRETVSTNEQLAIQSVDQGRIENIEPQGERLQLTDTEHKILNPTEVRKWNQETPKSLPSEMYTDHQLEHEEQWQRENSSMTLSRSIVGLVGPYRVHNSPIGKSEYILQEEELIEEMVDSVNSEKVQMDNQRQEDEHHRQRAKWRIRKENDNDEEIIASDVRKLPSNQIHVAARKIKDHAGNEQHDKDSLNETGSITGGIVEGAPGGAPNRGDRSKDNDQIPPQLSTSPAPARSLVSRILARTRSPDELLDHSEPYSQLWVVLSNVYGELVIVLTMALCLAEVMDTPVPLLSLQSVFHMYLYVGSIAVIIGIYIWLLVDSCGSFKRSNGFGDAELGGASLTRFGSLKRAHISRARTAPTSFYIRVGALLFGLATLVFNGLEMAMHSMMQDAECLTDVIFVHPVLHGLFTFLQMHFLFVNSQVLVERFGLAARFGFTHLAATNIAVWMRLVIWDSAQEWTYFVHLAQNEQQTSISPLNLRGFPVSLTRQSRDIIDNPTIRDHGAFKPYQPVSNEQISQVIALQECLNTNTLGQLWTSSMPFLYPFIVQFSLIAAAVTFVMGQNVGRTRLSKQKFHGSKDVTSHIKVGCDGSSKGLFLGILCMVTGIVVILIFLVVREDESFPSATLSWLTCGTLIGILTLSSLMTVSGLMQVRQISMVTKAPAALDSLLSNVSLFGVQLYSVFTIVVCACSLAMTDQEETEDTRARHIMLLSMSALQLLQCFAQSTLIAETSRRSCITRFQIVAKPGRQVITFLLFSNAVLWAFDTVITQNWLSQELQLRFFGVLAWGILSRIGLPLLIFYRFHSCVLLLEAWNKCYRMPREHPLN